VPAERLGICDACQRLARVTWWDVCTRQTRLAVWLCAPCRDARSGLWQDMPVAPYYGD
jgi:hypothetical protein